MTTDLTCNVCERQPAVGVASSTLGAMSLAYCQQCLIENADATFMLAGNIYSIGPNPNDYAEWFWSSKTFYDGRYITAREYFDIVTQDPHFFDPPPEDSREPA